MSGTVWEATCSKPEREALSRSDDLPPTCDVLVVGGGIVGLATAAMCVRAGLGRVVVVERERLAHGTSGSALGGLGPGPHALDPAPFPELARRSLELYRTLEAEWDGALGLVEQDWVAAMSQPDAEELAPLMGAELVERDALHGVQPELGPEVEAGLRFSGQPRVHPLRLAAGFAARAGTIVTGAEAVVTTRRTVKTSRGEVSAGAVVWAAGTAPSEFATIPQELVKGHLVATEPAPFRLVSSYAIDEIGIVQLPDGRLVAGGTVDEGDHDDVVRTEVVERIRMNLARLLPSAKGLAVDHRWCCFRPATSDRLPVIDRVPGQPHAWFTCGHFRTGLLMAPLTGELLAEWIRSEERPKEIAELGASRFG